VLWRAQQPAARNWLYAHTQNFYDEMSLNKIGTGLCGGQQPADSRFAAAPIPPQSPLDGIFAQGVTTGTYTEVGMDEQTRSSCGILRIIMPADVACDAAALTCSCALGVRLCWFAVAVCSTVLDMQHCADHSCSLTVRQNLCPKHALLTVAAGALAWRRARCSRSASTCRRRTGGVSSCACARCRTRR